MPATRLPARTARHGARDLRVGPAVARSLLQVGTAADLSQRGVQRATALAGGRAAVLVATRSVCEALGAAPVERDLRDAGSADDLLGRLASSWLAAVGEQDRQALGIAVRMEYSHADLNAAAGLAAQVQDHAMRGLVDEVDELARHLRHLRVERARQEEASAAIAQAELEATERLRAHLHPPREWLATLLEVYGWSETPGVLKLLTPGAWALAPVAAADSATSPGWWSRMRDLLPGRREEAAPAAPGPAPKGLASTGDPSFCTLWTLCGMPAISLPLLQSANGLPLGVQLVGPRLGDARLLRTARWLAARVATG